MTLFECQGLSNWEFFLHIYFGLNFGCEIAFKFEFDEFEMDECHICVILVEVDLFKVTF